MHQLQKKLKLQKVKKQLLKLLKHQQKALKTQKKLKDNYYSNRWKKAEFMKFGFFLFPREKETKTSSLKNFDGMDCAEIECIKSSKFLMRPFLGKEGRCNCATESSEHMGTKNKHLPIIIFA